MISKLLIKVSLVLFNLYDVRRSGKDLLQPSARVLGALRRGCVDWARVRTERSDHGGFAPRFGHLIIPHGTYAVTSCPIDADLRACMGPRHVSDSDAF